MEALLIFAVVSDDIEAAGHRNEKLMAFPESMTGAIGPTGNVVKIEDSLDLKRDVAVAFEEGQVATRIIYLR